MKPTETSTRAGLAALLAALLLAGARGLRCGAETRADYRFEYYAEEHHRTLVRTQAAEVNAGLTDALRARAEFVYDVISGATPIGGPPPEGSDQVPTAELTDTRRAGSLELAWTQGRHTVKPLFAYSLESDYESISPALNWEIDFNRKNTTLLMGLAGNDDRVFAPTMGGRRAAKRSGDVLLGVTQVLGPTTLASVNLTIGTASGFLSDPYKRVRFDLAPEGVLELERRPGHRTRQIFETTLRQFITPMAGSLEIAYRGYRDSFGIAAHTAGLTWFQNLGRWVVLSPNVRYYTQSAATFFAPQFSGDPSNPDLSAEFPVPAAYSSDYRLSRLHTWTYGLGCHWKLGSHWTFDLAYQRYEMRGDHAGMAASHYPSANIYTLGLGATF